MSSACQLWQPNASIASIEKLFELEDAKPPRFSFVNRTEMCGVEDARFDCLPTPRLLITEPDFAPDLIFEGFLFASAALRSAMALSEGDVRYHAVEVTGSTPKVQGADYRMVEVLEFADPIDYARSEGEIIDVPGPRGVLAREWQRSGGGPDTPVGVLYWRRDFTPPAPLFHCAELRSMLATDDLADRVMRAGLDVVFVDITGQTSRSELVLRRLAQR